MKRMHLLAATALAAVIASLVPTAAIAADTYPDPSLSIQIPPGKLYGGDPVTIGATSSVSCSTLSITFLGDTAAKKGSTFKHTFDTPVVKKVTPEPVSASCTYTDANGASTTVTSDAVVTPAAFVGPLSGAVRKANATIILLPRDGGTSADDSNGLLPNTGGLPFWLLVAGLVLVLVGGVVASRRRRA